MLLQIIQQESIALLPADDSISELELLRRSVELYILKVQDKTSFLQKRAEYCPEIEEESEEGSESDDDSD